MNHLLFVVNPISGGIDKDRIISQIKDFCAYKTVKAEVFYTTGTNDQDKIKTEIETHQPDALIVSGGDGTINLVTPLLLRYQLKLGIIPAGSANGLATEFGITMENAFEVLAESKTQPLDIILLDEEKYMLHLADFGLNAMLVRRYEEENRRGILGYAISAIQELGTLKDPFQVKIETSEGVKEFRTRFVVLANAQRYGTGFLVNPKGRHGDQQIELCILKEISPQQVINHLTQDEHMDNDPAFFEILSVNEATIQCDRPVDFQSDGEYWGEKDQLKVQVLDQQVELFTPA